VPSDLFEAFKTMEKDLTPWLRNRGFEGKGKRFEMSLSPTRHLVFGLMKSRWNRRAEDTFRYVAVAHLSDETGRPLWDWRSSWDSGKPGRVKILVPPAWERFDPDEQREQFAASLKADVDAAMREADSYWQVLTHDSDTEQVANTLKAAIETSLLPAAQHEVADPSSPPLAGLRFVMPDEDLEPRTPAATEDSV
jgi:hypothetical protein